MVTFGPAFPGLDAAALAGLRTGVTSAGNLPGRTGDRETVSTGWPALDGLLPAGGVSRGGLIEWLAGDPDAASPADSCGAATLACAVACRLAATRRTRRGDVSGGLIVVVDRAGWFHPPAVLPWLGAEPGGASRLVVARPSRADDEIWAIEQSLRCAGVAAVVAWPRLEAAWTVGRGMATERRLTGHAGLQQWTTAMRRWQLAARSVGATGLFVRSAAALREPSWAESRLAVSALPGGSLLERHLRIARVGGAWCGAESDGGKPVEIVLDLARGRAGAPAVGTRTTRRSMTAGPRPDVGVEGGASCRAS